MNEIGLARRCPDFRHRLLPVAEGRMGGDGQFGARWTWETLEDGLVEGAPQGMWLDHVFHMGTIARTAWMQYTYSGDRKYLEDCGFPILRGCARFFSKNIVYKDSKGNMYIGKCTDFERLGPGAEKPFMTTVGAVYALRCAADAASIIGAEGEEANGWRNIADALVLSQVTLGRVDIEYMASITGRDYKTVIESLRGAIYQNPDKWEECFYKGWETADEYLSGNIMHKYKIAKEANEAYNGYFDANIKALESVMEPDIEPKDIYVTLGSPWVPTDVIDDFILHLLGTEPPNKEQYYTQDFAVRHDETTGIWEIPRKTRFREASWHGKYENVCYKTWGTKRMEMLYLLERTLNMKTISITDAIDEDGKIRVINQSETVKALEKQEEMIAEFQSWVWKKPERRKRLQAAYCRLLLTVSSKLELRFIRKANLL
jgi:hypothetical protein